MNALWLRRVLLAALRIVGLAALAGAAAAQGDMAISSLAQQGKHHELIRAVQPRLDRGEPVSGFQLLLLGSAYYEVRQHRGLLSTAEMMDKRIAQGDRSYFGGDLSVYPTLFRASAAHDLGSYEEAARLAAQARERLKPDQFFYRIQAIQANGLLGVANAFLGRVDEARKNVEAIREISLAMSNIGPEKYAAMARIHMALREFDKALDAISHPDAKVSGILTAFYDETFQNMPKFFIRAKSLYETRRPEAKQAYDDILNHPQIAQYGGLYWLALHDRARIALQESDARTAIELLRRAVQVIEEQRSSIDSESGRIGFVGDKQSVYQTLVALLVDQGEHAAAFEYVERSKARALVDMLAGKRDFGLADPGAAQRVRELLAAADRAEAAARAFEPTAEAGAAKRSLLIARREELSQSAPELSSLVSVAAVDAGAVRALLPADEILLEYFYGGEALYAFIATREGVQAVRLEARGLEADTLAFRQAIQEPGSDKWREPARRLHARLVAPLQERLRAPNLLIVPHGALHYLPFNALHDGEQFLAERFSLRLLPAATVLQFLKGPPADKPGMLLAFGNPDLGDSKLDLAFAQKEAEDVAKTMPNSRVLTRREASRAAFRKYASDFRILHVASHGEFDAEKPLESSLRLAPDAGDDGRLTVADLYSMRVDADLVTLSACETGLGKIANGDDVVGLNRGFLYAGARTIIASLWQVDDRATNELMSAFYQSLGKGLAKRQALRAAQSDILKRQPHPFFWAAFQLTGNP